MGAVKRNNNQSNRHSQAQQQAAQQQAAQQQEIHEQALAQAAQDGTSEGAGGAEELKTRRSCLHKQLRKTKFCMYHLQGVCMFGDNCAFAHNCSELQGAPDLRKTRLCKAYVAGHCKDQHCTFAHGEEELHSTDLFYKKTLCIWYEKGRCRNNEQCRFAHGTKELRVRGGALPQRAAGGGSEKPSAPRGASGGGKSAGTAAGRSAAIARGAGNGGQAEEAAVGRAGGRQVENHNAATGDMMGDWALIGNHLGSAPNANASGTANMLSARHLAAAAAMAASEGSLNAVAGNGAALHGAVRNGAPVQSPGNERQPQPAMLEPMFVHPDKPGLPTAPASVLDSAAHDQQLVSKLMQVQQLQQQAQQLLIHQQLQKQWSSFAAAAMAGRSGSGASTQGPQEAAAANLEQFAVSESQVESLQRASAAALAAAGALGAVEGGRTAAEKSMAESDLEKLTQSVVALTMQLHRFEKQMSMHGTNNGQPTPPRLAAPTSAPPPIANMTPEDQAMLVNAVATNAANVTNSMNTDVSAGLADNVRGVPLPPWPPSGDNAALLKQIQMMNPETLSMLSNQGAGENYRNGNGIAPYTYGDLVAAVQMAGLLM